MCNMPCSVPVSLHHSGGSLLWLLVGEHWLRTSFRSSGHSLTIFWLLTAILPYAAKTAELSFSVWPFSLAGLTSSYYCVHPESMHHSILAFLYRGAIHYSICSLMLLVELAYFEHSKCVKNIRSQTGPWMRGKKFKLKCWLLEKNLAAWVKVVVFSVVLRTLLALIEIQTRSC